jgi:hypothetical protein
MITTDTIGGGEEIDHFAGVKLATLTTKTAAGGFKVDQAIQGLYGSFILTGELSKLGTITRADSP